MKRCLNIQEECLGYEAVRAEAETEDKDRPRIMINPDFVESQDRSDGAEQYDPEEASRTGRAVVTTEEGAPASEICFLCGSAGQVRINERVFHHFLYFFFYFPYFCQRIYDKLQIAN